MNGLAFLLVAHLLLCGYLLITVFERAVAMSSRVRDDVRCVFGVLGTAAAFGFVAPFVFTSWQPDPFGVVMTAAICIVQHVTARHWTKGVPDCFYRPEFMPRRRRADDVDVAL